MHKVRHLLSLMLAFSLLFSVTVVASAQEDDQDLDIVETAMSAGNLETLVAAIQAAGLVEALQEEGPFTVFAPIDDAFAELPEAAFEALLEDPEGLLAPVLLYHVVPGLVLSTDIEDGMTAETLHGASLTFGVTDDGVTVGYANIVTADMMTSNGVVHLIDVVLLPPVDEGMDDDMTGYESEATEEAVADEEAADQEAADQEATDVEAAEAEVADEDVDEDADEEEVTAEEVDEETIQGMLEEFTPSIQAQDQVFRVRDGQFVIVPELFATQDGWVVIHLDRDGAPGPVIGFEFVEAGPHFDLIVEIDEIQTEDTALWAMLHVDEGVAGEYEFPGPDVPARLDGQIVMANFTALAPTVMIDNQSVVDGTVTAEGVVTAADSWLVIHRSNETGGPGEVIGHAPAAPGVTPNVTVELTAEVDEGEQLWAMLHYDLGVQGEYEFPGADVPIRLAEQVVMTAFTVGEDGEMAAEAAEMADEEAMTETEDAEAMEETATATDAHADHMATEAPAMLPTTGGSFSENNNTLPWAAGILVMLLAGGILFYRRRIA